MNDQKKLWLHFVSPSDILLVFLQRNIVEPFNLCKINDIIIFFRIRWFHMDVHFFEPFSNRIQFIFGDLFLIHINEAINISDFSWNTKWNAFVATWNNFQKFIKKMLKNMKKKLKITNWKGSKGSKSLKG